MKITSENHSDTETKNEPTEGNGKERKNIHNMVGKLFFRSVTQMNGVLYR